MLLHYGSSKIFFQKYYKNTRNHLKKLLKFNFQLYLLTQVMQDEKISIFTIVPYSQSHHLLSVIIILSYLILVTYLSKLNFLYEYLSNGFCSPYFYIILI